MGEIDQAAGEIAARADEYWRATNRPMLLSNLGTSLSPRAKQVARETRGSLNKFIEFEMPHQLRLLPLIVHGGGVAPADATRDVSDADLESRVPPPQRKSDSVRRQPYFYASIWRLFSSPWPGGLPYIDLTEGGEPVLHNVEDQSTALPDWIPVKPDDLPAPSDESGGLQPSEIAESIRRWASLHSIDTRKLRPEATSEPARIPLRKPPEGAKRHGSPLRSLEHFLSTLEPHELSRFSLAGDLLLDLLRRDQA